MNNLFDKIILINLPSRKDRLERSINELMRVGITHFEIFPAIEKENGAEGLFYTMMAIFDKCHQAGYKKVLILEDDFKFLMQPKFFIEKCFHQFYQFEGYQEVNWDILHLGPNMHGRFDKWETRYMLPLQNGLATHAIVYSGECIKKIVDMDLVWSGIPYDQILATQIQKLGNSYCTYPLLATQFDDYSNIENINVTYNHIEHKFYKNVESILDK